VAAGVSKATASYALNGRPEVAEETRDRVLLAASDLDYHPNRAAREIATGSMADIGVVFSPTVHEDKASNYYLSELLIGVEEVLRASEFRLHFTVWHGKPPALTQDGTVSGLIYLGGSFPSDLASLSSAPAVLIGSSFAQWPYDAVLADNRRGAYLAVSHLAVTGRRNIGFINGPNSTQTSAVKRLGHEDAIIDNALEADERWIRNGDFTIESGRELARGMFATPPYPDGLFIADDPMAIGVLKALADLGIRVPDDVAVVGYGNSPAASYSRPSLTSVRVFQQKMGNLGAGRLLDRLSRHVGEYIRILVAPEMAVRESSAP